MNKGCSFVFILLSGLLFFIALVFFLDDKKSLRESDEVVDEDVIEYDHSIKAKPVQNIQYVEIRGKKGEVTVHTNMSKDSVKLLVGKPTRTNLITMGSDAHEKWEYDFPGEGQFGTIRELQISFVNGELKEIREY